MIPKFIVDNKVLITMAITITVTLSFSLTININTINTVNVVQEKLNQTQAVLNDTTEQLDSLQKFVDKNV